MRKLLLTILLFAGAAHIGAQTPFTEQLQKTVPGKGTVVLYQSQAITDLVNGVDASAPAGKVVHETSTTTGTAKPQDVLTDLPSGNASAVKVRMNGYRIQTGRFREAVIVRSKVNVSY